MPERGFLADTGLDNGLPLTGARTDAHDDGPSWHSATDLLGAVFNGAVEQPVNGVFQLVNHVTGTKLLPQIDLLKPEPAEFGSFNWHLQQIGGAAGMAVPFLLLHKGVSSVGERVLPEAARAFFTENSTGQLMRPMLQAGATGAAFEGILHPVSDDEKNFGMARARNALVGGLTFSALTGTTTALGALGRSSAIEGTVAGDILNNRFSAGFLSSIPAGLMNAELSSKLSGRGWASSNDLFQTAYGYGIVGGTMGLLHGLDDAKSAAVSRPDVQPVAPEQPGISLLLDGGAVRGWGHIGVLKYLEENNVKIDHEYGVSIGGLVASLHTRGYDANQIRDIFLDEFHNPEVLRYLPGRVTLRSLVRFKNLEPLMNYFTEKYDLQPNDRLHIFAQRLRTTQPYLFEGTNYDLPVALRATAGIPGPFRWTRVAGDAESGGRKIALVDGGFRKVTANNLPGDTDVIISRLGGPDHAPKPVPTFGSRIYNRFAKIGTRLMHSDEYTPEGTQFVVKAGLPEVTSLGFALPDATYQHMIDYGYVQAKLALGPAIREGLLPTTDQAPTNISLEPTTPATNTSPLRRSLQNIRRSLFEHT
jgi:hypothetical protein